MPPPVTANPLQGARLFVDPSSLAMLNANRMRKTDAQKAELLDRIALQPQGLWMGEWNSDIFRAVQHFVDRATQDQSVAVIIAYNIPHRDAAATEADAGHSAGGLATQDAYRRWIRDVHAGIGDRPILGRSSSLGLFTNDPGRTRRELDENAQERLAIFCRILGYIIEDLRQRGQALPWPSILARSRGWATRPRIL